MRYSSRTKGNYFWDDLWWKMEEGLARKCEHFLMKRSMSRHDSLDRKSFYGKGNALGIRRYLTVFYYVSKCKSCCNYLDSCNVSFVWRCYRLIKCKLSCTAAFHLFHITTFCWNLLKCNLLVKVWYNFELFFSMVIAKWFPNCTFLFDYENDGEYS